MNQICADLIQSIGKVIIIMNQQINTKKNKSVLREILFWIKTHATVAVISLIVAVFTLLATVYYSEKNSYSLPDEIQKFIIDYKTTVTPQIPSYLEQDSDIIVVRQNLDLLDLCVTQLERLVHQNVNNDINSNCDYLYSYWSFIKNFQKTGHILLRKCIDEDIKFIKKEKMDEYKENMEELESLFANTINKLKSYEKQRNSGEINQKKFVKLCTDATEDLINSKELKKDIEYIKYIISNWRQGLIAHLERLIVEKSLLLRNISKQPDSFSIDYSLYSYKAYCRGYKKQQANT